MRVTVQRASGDAFLGEAVSVAMCCPLMTRRCMGLVCSRVNCGYHIGNVGNQSNKTRSNTNARRETHIAF